MSLSSFLPAIPRVDIARTMATIKSKDPDAPVKENARKKYISVTVGTSKALKYSFIKLKLIFRVLWFAISPINIGDRHCRRANQSILIIKMRLTTKRTIEVKIA